MQSAFGRDHGSKLYLGFTPVEMECDLHLGMPRNNKSNPINILASDDSELGAKLNNICSLCVRQPL